MPADDILMDCELQMDKAIEHLHHELRAVRTGRASPALVEHIRVDYYGTTTDLKSISSISVPEATQILIKPFNPQDIKAIDKALNESKLGLTAHNDGRTLRLQLPSMSQDRRMQLAGQCKGYAEAAKISVRGARRDANKLVETEEKGGVVTEDEAEKSKETIQEMTKTYETKIEEIVEKKRHDIMEK